jgi:hypothetical protein
MHPSSGNLFATTVDGYLAVFDAQLRRLDCRATGIKDPEFNPILGFAL